MVAIDSALRRCKSHPLARIIAKEVSAFLKFRADNRDGGDAHIAGDSAQFVLRDFCESIADRGRTAPAAATRALKNWTMP